MVDNWESVDEVISLPFLVSHVFESQYHAVFEGVIERCREAQTENAYRLFTKWLGLNLPDELLVPRQKPKRDKVKECHVVISNWNIFPKSFIIFQLRASSPIRTPRPRFWKTLIDKVTARGHKVVITDSPHMSGQVDKFIETLVNQDRVFNFAQHSETLDYTIALASLAKLAVSTDTSLLHLAASMDVPAFGIYGPFPGKIRLSTYKNVRWIDCKASCAPCFQHGPTPCKNSFEGHSTCYDNIDFDKCVEEIEGMIDA
jgi:ADP-heptose:LPS heptosyltransferase